MTIRVAIDTENGIRRQSRLFDFESTSDYVGTGIRVRPSELARLFGVTKQAVSSWIKEGKIQLGVDGRIDPRKAIQQLLAHGDPSRLRVSFLRPFVDEINATRQEITRLAALCDELTDSTRFYEESSRSLAEIIDALELQLPRHWEALAGVSDTSGLHAIMNWLEVAQKYGAVEAGEVINPENDDFGSLPIDSNKGNSNLDCTLVEESA